MKYRDLKLTFSIDRTFFTILSICLEKLMSPIPKHCHSKNSYELHYISYGYGTLITNDKKYDIIPGSLFMTGPGIEHEQISYLDDPMTEYCIYLKVDSQNGKHKNKLIQSFEHCAFWIGTDNNCIHELMKQIMFELEAKNIGYEFVLQALLQQVILQMIRYYNKETLTNFNHIAPLQNVSDLSFLIIEEAFLYDYKSITLEDLANRVNLGKRQTERLLRQHYNKTFLQKKTEARMFAACTLLQKSNLSISSIAYELGYSSVEHFSAAFKNFYHITPSTYRKSKNTT